MYIGNSPLYQSFPRDRFNGGEASYTLTYNPQTPSSLLVIVDGVVQDATNDYTTDGTTLTPTTAWPVGTNNVVVIYLGRSADIGTPSDDTVGTNQLQALAVTTAKIDNGAVTHEKRTYNSGEVIQSAYAETATRTVSNVALPGDNTIPQNTEGTELLTVSITPKFTTSKLRVRFSGYFSNQQGAAGSLGIALFRDSTANAIAANQSYGPATAGSLLGTIERVVDASALTATTFKVRFGPNSAAGSGFVANGGGVTTLFGGVDYCTLTVEEIAA